MQEQLTVDLGTLPREVARVVVAASIDVGDFSAVPGLHLRLESDRVQRVDGAVFGGRVSAVRFDLPRLGVERAVLLAELYRRDQGWRVRAIGQGYADGLAGLARDFGVDVD